MLLFGYKIVINKNNFIKWQIINKRQKRIHNALFQITLCFILCMK